jgi:hypothetical protein
MKISGFAALCFGVTFFAAVLRKSLGDFQNGHLFLSIPKKFFGLFSFRFHDFFGWASIYRVNKDVDITLGFVPYPQDFVSSLLVVS